METASCQDQPAVPRQQAADDGACTNALTLVSALTLPMALRAAIELGLLDAIARSGQSGLTAAELAAQLPAQNPQAPAMLDRMLRLLASHCVLTCKVEAGADDGRPVLRRYGAAPVCRYLTRNEDGVSFAAFGLLNTDKVFAESCYYLKDVVLEGGIPSNKAHGMTAWDNQAKDPRLNVLFNEALKNHSAIVSKEMLESYKGFDSVRVLVDVGGGVGATLHMITSKYPHIKGINFDLPHVISEAQLFPGVEHIAGDMFENIPTGDAILLKTVLHNWGDDYCLKILKNCWKALPDSGKVIILDLAIPEEPELQTSKAHSVFQLDLLMLVCFPGGQERTKEELKYLAEEAGFTGFNTMYCFANFWVIELTK